MEVWTFRWVFSKYFFINFFLIIIKIIKRYGVLYNRTGIPFENFEDYKDFTKMDDSHWIKYEGLIINIKIYTILSFFKGDFKEN